MYIPGEQERFGCHEELSLSTDEDIISVFGKDKLVRSFQSIDADYLILDLGAGTHQIILDMFLLSAQGIIVTAPTVTATLNGYLFLKNAVFRLMYTTFKKGTARYNKLKALHKDSTSLQRLYIPKLLKSLNKTRSSASASPGPS